MRALVVWSLLLALAACKREQARPPVPLPLPSPLNAPAPASTARAALARRNLPALEIPPHQPGTLLGGELGLDHVAIAVRDLEATKTSFQQLGFANPSPGKLPNGIANLNYYFADTTYLETMSAWDAKRAAWLAKFTEKQEGPYFLALCVHSAEETAAFLKQRGFATAPPVPGRIQVPGETASAAEMWKTLFFKRSPFPEGSLFFIAYGRQVRQSLFDRLKTPQIRRRHFSHPNTALGVRAVWMGVKDAAAASRAFQSMGLTPARAVESSALGARGRLIQAGIGDILVLEPREAGGKLAAFLASRGEGLFGLSIQVHSLAMARFRMDKDVQQSLQPSSGFYGQSLLLPPELTHGAWMELSE